MNDVSAPLEPHPLTCPVVDERRRIRTRRRLNMSEEPSASQLEKALGDINFVTSSEQLEKLKLLAACVVPSGLILEKNVPEIYHETEKKLAEKATAVSIYKRLLNKAGISKRHVDKLSTFMIPAQATCDIPNLYFTEVLVSVSDHIGNGESFRDLKNRVPSHRLEVNRDNIPTCVRLFQLLLQKDVLSTSDPNASLILLEEWLKDIYRNDVARIVRGIIASNDQSVSSTVHGGIQPQGDGDLRQPVQET